MQPEHVPGLDEPRPPIKIAPMRLAGDPATQPRQVGLDHRLPLRQRDRSQMRGQPAVHQPRPLLRTRQARPHQAANDLHAFNSLVRLIFTRTRGFHSAEAALALVRLTCGPITHRLPHEQPKIRPG